MERSTIKLLEKRGNSNTEIARALGRDLKTVKRALIEPADKEYNQPKRGSLVDGYEVQIRQWLTESLPVTVMLQKAREDEVIPYQGGNTIFYQRVQLIRRELKIENQKAIWRFEGLPGEYLQVDWGEKRNFPFQRIPPETRYGAAYVELVLRMPPNEEERIQLLLSGQPIQSQIDRDLTVYDTYTHR